MVIVSLILCLSNALLIPKSSNSVTMTQQNDACLNRNSVLNTISLVGSALILGSSEMALASNKMEDVMNTNILSMPPPSRASEFQGVDNTYFPRWMEGEWELTQTLVDFQTPLGVSIILLKSLSIFDLISNLYHAFMIL